MHLDDDQRRRRSHGPHRAPSGAPGAATVRHVAGPTANRSLRLRLLVTSCLVAAVLAALLPLGSMAEAAPAPGVSSELEDMAARADLLASDLVAVESSLSVARAASLQADAALSEAALRAGLAQQTRQSATATLGEVAVASYLAGGRIPDSLVAEVLTADRHSIDADAKIFLATTVHRHVVDQHRQAVVEDDRRRAALASARSLAADARVHLAQLERDAEALAAQLRDAEVQRDAVVAQAQEATLALAAREAEARAGVPPAQPVATGVVPPRTVPDDVATALAGHIAYTPLDAYWRAAALTNATRPGCDIDWALIAGIGLAESRHGTYGGSSVRPDGTVFPAIIGIPLDGTNGTARIVDTDGGLYDGDAVYDRAVGPMQFIPGTWAGYAGDGNGDGVADPHNIYDTAYAAGIYLCSRAGGSLTQPEAARRAVHGYNRSWAYVNAVLASAASYRTMAPGSAQLALDEAPGETTGGSALQASSTTTTSMAPGSSTTTTSSAPTTTTSPSSVPDRPPDGPEAEGG